VAENPRRQPPAPGNRRHRISLDEIHRLNNRRANPYEQPVYPPLDHTPPLRRTDCTRLIRAAGLPLPPKSSCWFCPLRRPSNWQAMRHDQPDLFTRACHLEAELNQRRANLGRDPVWLTRFNRPLDQAVPDTDQPLPYPDTDDGGCDTGHCHT